MRTYVVLALVAALLVLTAPAVDAQAARAPTSVLRPGADAWRLRGLAAFDTVWRTIDRTHFDPTFGGLDWRAVRQEFRPHVEAAGSADEQRAVIREMLARLGQSHFALLSGSDPRVPPRGPAEVPVEVRIKGDEVVVTRVLDDASGLRPGDRILAADGVVLTSLMTDLDISSPMRVRMVWARVMHKLSGTGGSTVRLRVLAPDEGVRELVVTRLVPPGAVVTVGNLPPTRASLSTEERRTADGHRVGVIRFNVWMAAVAQPFAEAIDTFRDADGIVIDLRGNPGGLAEMMRGIAGHLVDEPVMLGRMRMRDLVLEFRANPRRATADGRIVRPYAGPVAILVDELTASASECFAGGLQALGRVRIFGRRTAGQALPASTEQLETGDVLLYAVGDFVTSDGRRLEGAGVSPDVEVPLDPTRLAAGFDAEAAAVEWIATLPRSAGTSVPAGASRGLKTPGSL